MVARRLGSRFADRHVVEDWMIDSSMLGFLISILIAVIIMAGLLIWLS